MNTGLITDVIYWTVIEAGIAIISCCLPATHSFTRRKLERSIRDSKHLVDFPLRENFLRSYGYRRKRDDKILESVELADVGQSDDRVPFNATRAIGLPVFSGGGQEDNNILMTRTVETVQERDGERQNIV